MFLTRTFLTTVKSLPVSCVDYGMANKISTPHPALALSGHRIWDGLSGYLISESSVPCTLARLILMV